MSEQKNITLPELHDLPIPHHKPRPGNTPPDGIIIHSMGQYIGGTFARDFLESVGLSAHYLIDHDGHVYCCVDPVRQAYHAGQSQLGDQQNLNSSFVGIELMVEGDHTYHSFLEAIADPETFTEKHYESCRWLCRKLVGQHDIPVDRIVRHSDVSGEDVRPDPKQDPGDGFDFSRLITAIQDLNEND